MWFSKKYHTDISDMPLYNWYKFQTTQDYGWLLKRYKFGEKENPEIWEKLYDQYIERVGLTDDFVELMNAMKEHALKIIQWIQNPTPINKTHVDVAKAELEALSIDESEGAKFIEFVASVTKFMGVPIDPKKISVEVFYGYVNRMKEESKWQKR